MRRVMAGLCAGGLALAALILSLAASTTAALPGFPDVPDSHPHSAAIADLASRDIIGGYTNGDFGPEDPVTRQQFAKMIVLTGGYPVSEDDICPFADVEASDPTTLYPDNYIAVAAAHQITKGVDATRFSPLRRISRLQVVSMAVRMADDVRPGLLVDPSPGWEGAVSWATDPSHGAAAARAEYHGLLAGLDLGSLDPYGDMSRGEVAQVLHNLLDRLETTVPGTTSTSAPSATSTTVSGTTSTTTPVTTPALEDLGGAITSAPATCSQGYGLLDVFARGADGTLMHIAWDGTSWSSWEDLGGALEPGSAPAAASWGMGRLDVFIRGTGDTLRHRWWDGSAWSEWEDLGGELAGNPTAAYRNKGGGQKWLDVFAPAPDGLLRHRVFDGVEWTPWTFGGVKPMVLEPGLSAGAATWGTTRIDLVACGVGGNLWRCYLPPSGEWSQWQNIGGNGTSSPAVSTWGSWAEGRFDVFVRGEDLGLWHISMVSNVWTKWENMGVGTIASGPASVSWGSRRIDVFVRGTDDTLRHRWWDGSQWMP